MFSHVSADDSLPFSSMEALSVLGIIFHDFSSREWACGEEKCVLQNHGWLVISLVLSPFPPCLTAGAVGKTAVLASTSSPLGSVSVWVASLWDQPFEFWDQMWHGRLVGTKGSRRFAPNSLWPDLSFLFCLQDCFRFNEFKSKLEGQLEGGVCLLK